MCAQSSHTPHSLQLASFFVPACFNKAGVVHEAVACVKIFSDVCDGNMDTSTRKGKSLVPLPISGRWEAVARGSNLDAQVGLVGKKLLEEVGARLLCHFFC